MTDGISNGDVTIKIKGSKLQIDKRLLTGAEVNKKLPIFLQDADFDADGVLNQKEAQLLFDKIKKAAKNGILSRTEFLDNRIGSKEDFETLQKTDLTKQEVSTTTEGYVTTTIIRNSDGSFVKKINNAENGSVIRQNYDTNGNLIVDEQRNANGSVRTTNYKYDSEGTKISTSVVEKDSSQHKTISFVTNYQYDERGYKIGSTTEGVQNGKPYKATSTIENNADGNPIKVKEVCYDENNKPFYEKNLSYMYGMNGKPKSISTKVVDTQNNLQLSTQSTFRDDGKTLETSSTIKKDLKSNDIEKSEYKYNAQGKLLTSHVTTTNKNNAVIQDITTNYEYLPDDKTISKFSKNGTMGGKPFSEIVSYDLNGKMTGIEKTFFKYGAKQYEYYDGPNLENRRGSVPTKRIEYEDDGVTVKRVTQNKFDADGVLVEQDILDKSGKVIDRHDFSKLDGNFDTFYQVGRGDCYLLSSLNALKESAAGRNLLKQTITEEIDTKTGEKLYTVHLPGAKEVRAELIARGVPEDKITIKESYTYSESQIHEKAKLAGKSYSLGDKDGLLLEVAYEQYRTDAKNDIYDLVSANPKMKKSEAQKILRVRGMNSKDKYDNLRSGNGADPTFLLTGKKAIEIVRNSGTSDLPVCSIDSDYGMTLVGQGISLSPEKDAQMNKVLDAIEKDCADGELNDYSASVGFIVSTNTINGQVEPEGGHELSIMKVEGDKVYLKNPWNPSDPDKVVVMTRDEVKNAMTGFFVTPLTPEGASRVNGEVVVSNPSSQPSNPTSPSAPSNPSNPVIQPPQEDSGGSSIQSPQSPSSSAPSQVEVSATLQGGKAYKVPKGKGYKTLLKEALVAQGIEPTPENVKKASEQFKAMNNNAVQIYNGSNVKYRGNEFIFQDAIVTIPQFKI